MHVRGVTGDSFFAKIRMYYACPLRVIYASTRVMNTRSTCVFGQNNFKYTRNIAKQFLIKIKYKRILVKHPRMYTRILQKLFRKRA